VRNKVRFYGLLSVMLVAIALFLLPLQKSQAAPDKSGYFITGFIMDRQGSAVKGAQVSLYPIGKEESLAETVSQPDGSFILVSDQEPVIGQTVHIQREHFESLDVTLALPDIHALHNEGSVELKVITLVRQINLSFWIATLVFIFMLFMVALGKLHNTLATLLGASVILAFSYLGTPFSNEYFIFNFTSALSYVDWNVIFLVMGMMIIIATVERTGIFQWLAFNAYKLSGARIWLLMPILMLITGVASAFLDNVTTMLLMAPMTIQISLAMGINPLVLLMPEVMASNIAGVSTLVGTPTNILIGSYGKISFNAFLTNLTPGVLLALAGLIIYSEYIYRKDLRKGDDEEASALLVEKLEERSKITDPVNLKKAGVVGAFMLVLFIAGDSIHLIPAVTALIGATLLLVWVRPDIEEMIEEVDWTTLVFFITLFIVVGAIQEVGLISLIADGIRTLVGENLLLAVLSVTWLSALLSMVIANIPFTAAMLPVIGYLTATIPGANSKVLFYCLSVGSAMGGNGSLIGASANMITSGIAERAGYPITYRHFMKKGFPALLITVGLASLWLVIRFLL
jgi:Na+/H+ antiporter NhaD/arsenite permease-like protein